MQSLYVAIPDEAAEQFRMLAARERRAPRQQAAWIIITALKAAGLDVAAAPRERVTLKAAPRP